MSKLTHFDEKGQPRMVDVSDKSDTQRMAIACCIVYMKSATLQLIQDKKVAKGDVLYVAQVAGIMAAKKTSELIPMCHPLNITSIKLSLEPNSERSCIEIEAQVKITGKTGVEMEALTAVAVAGLTVYDMCKAVDRDITISDIRLIEKSGGKSGEYKRENI
ncbi:MAG: cyclic pyranopterin monophosphate synthase MoaC [Nitrospirae bacterium]|nr:cyclic pyranopterin monophosphate synthase MoaC [Nitrospirota bacterium]